MRVDKAELLFPAQNETGESPVWDEAGQRLWWTDIPGRTIHWLDPQSGVHRGFDMPGRVGSFALRRGGGLILAMEQGFSFFDPETGAVEPIAEPEAGLSKHRFNDGRCDRAGRFLAGSMNLDRDAASAKLWRVDQDRSVTELLDDCTVANGLAFDAAGRVMYWVDGGRRQIFRFNYSADGIPTDRQIFQDDGTAPGRPDGGAVDAEGCYWSARWLGSSVVRFTPDGQLDRLIALPTSRVTMCAFGGPDYKTLFITTAREGMSAAEQAAEPHAGDVFVLQLDTAGLPEPVFGG